MIPFHWNLITQLHSYIFRYITTNKSEISQAEKKKSVFFYNTVNLVIIIRKMLNKFLFFFGIIFVLRVHCENDLPCDYENSINISSGILNSNQSITHEYKLYEFGLYTLINYKIENGKNISVEPYFRACIYNDSLPCKFSDSINITDGQLLNDSLFQFDYMLFPKDTYANVTFKYIIKSKDVLGKTFDFFTRISVPTYRRGCVCNRKSCIRICCPSPYHELNGKQCIKTSNKDISLTSIDENYNKINVHLRDKFYYVTSKFCGKITEPDNSFFINEV